ncbi:putative membrane protein DUF2207 [Natranaerovirga hydrolytica]|uniref:Putative membrane protein DUF2207 n=1 Tax=Natranaerovirga hydrolytica TaxID=680378 RepID=A0A4R1MYQ8_9FIRM|nr:DUF2207 domain-containing protein [Natranaerovirga hydrolytica]TCK97740.1 putative membrane protein DUF2207 [Natranaerovirga hydrolytica]
MPWCPECKMEYEEGVEKCADCQINLVEDLNDDSLYWVDLLESEDKNNLEEIKSFLEYSKINAINIIKNEERNVFVLQVKEDESEEASKFASVFLYNKKMEKREEETQEQIEDESTKEGNGQEDVFEDKNKKLEDIKSTAFSFITVGIIGLIFVVLVMLEYININMDPTFRQIFLPLLLVIMFVFIGIGLSSFIKIKQAKEEVDVYNQKVNAIKQYIKEHYTKEHIDDHCELDDNEEMNYFKRTEYIKKGIRDHFDDVEESMMDAIVDEIYEDIY